MSNVGQRESATQNRVVQSVLELAKHQKEYH